jgi:general stress protein YciG
MDPELRSALARKGGIAAHARGKAHEFTPEEARIAGRKGAAGRIKPQRSDQRARREQRTSFPPPADR